MERRKLLVLAGLLAGCGGGVREAEYPKEVEGGWKLVGVEDKPAIHAPQELQLAGLQRWRWGRYEGTGWMDVFLYKMGTPAAAFEMQQKWRSEPGMLAGHLDNLFIVYRPDRSTPEAVRKFPDGFERALKGM
jgi:hypothetical protein